MNSQPARPAARNPVTGNSTNALLAAGLGLLLLAGFIVSALGLAPGGLAWTVLRASGIVAYLALAVTVTFGALLGSRYAPAWLLRAQQYGWHGLLSGFSLLLGAVHGLFLTVDAQHPESLLAVVVPGAAHVSPLLVGLGSLGLYGLALVYGTTRWRGRLSHRWWRALHLVSYPAFVALTLHGALTGSDHLGPLYAAALMGVAVTFSLRVLDHRGRRAG